MSDPTQPAAPEPRPRAPGPFAVGTLLVAAFAAVILPGQRPGLGVLVVGVLVGALAASVAAPWRPWPVTMAALGLSLGVMVVIRAAPWLVALDLLAALGLGVVAMLGSARWGELLTAPLVTLARVFRAPGFLARGIPLGSTRVVSPVVRVAVATSLLLLVFGSLFAAADQAFARLAGDYLIPSWDLESLPVRGFSFVFVALLAGTLGLLAPRYAAFGPGAVDVERSLGLGMEPRSRFRRLEWVVPLALLDLLFVAFVAIQAAFLFRDEDHVMETIGLTYADYARQGFFQLLVVAGLTLGVVAVAARWAVRETRRDEVLLRGLLGILCALTLVVLASAHYRLALYEEAFGLTVPRFVAHEAVLWIGGLIVLVSIAGATLRTAWLPRTAVVFSAAVLLAGSISDPEARVAEANVERWKTTGDLDVAYLATLGADAVPAVAELPPRLRACVIPAMVRNVDPPDGIWGWNLARERAEEAIGAAYVSASLCRAPR